MSWRVARSLDVLLNEVNAAAPSRSKVSDGTVGDLSHQARPSDHNPNSAGVVRARDITHDPRGGCDAGALAHAVVNLAKRGHPALGSGAYVIWNWRIASATYGWAWRSYSGSNGHTQHVHVSVSTAASGYDNTSPWGVMGATEEDPMAQYEDQLAEIARKQDQTLKEVRAFRAGKAKNDAKVRQALARLEREVKDDATKSQVREVLSLLDADE